MEVNIDYILDLISNSKGKLNGEVVANIKSAISSSFQLRSKVKLIEDFVNNLTGDDVNGEWRNYIEKQITKDLDQIINREHLKPEETYEYVSSLLANHSFDKSGVALANLLPPVSRFSNERERIKNRVVSELEKFFNKY